MNVIILIENGILNTPQLIKNDTTAAATYQSTAEKLLGTDIEEVDFNSDFAIHQVNKLLEGTGKELLWFTDLTVNKYKN